MIDQQTIDRVLDAAKIVEVVSDFVTLRRRGVNYTGLCPFHNEKTPSFSVSEAKGICKCFSCGKGGNAVHFIMEHEQMSYYEAIRYLAKKYNIEIQERELTEAQKQAQSDRESMFILNSFAQKYFSSTLTGHIEGKSVGLSYFRERGFRDDVIAKFQLGYSVSEPDAFAKEALKSGYKKELLLKTGLCSQNDKGDLFDRYRERVIFPIHSLSGKVVAFGGRILRKTDKLAKYVNSPESEIYHKSSELYGIYFAKQAIVKQDLCYLVEGYTDVLSMYQAGIENVVASSGTALTQGQIRLIHRFTNNICVLYDGDAAGIKASIRGIDLLLEEGLNVKVVLLPEGEDPDSFAQKHNATGLTDYLRDHEVDFIRFKTTLLLEEAGKDPVKKAGLITDIVRSISLIPDAIMRSVYIKECSRLMDIDERTLNIEVNKRKEIQAEKEYQREQADQLSSYYGNTPTDHMPPEVAMQQEVPVKKRYRFSAHEREIVRILLKYGEVIFCEIDTEEGATEKVSVCEYIGRQLDMDELTLENPLYKRILEEAREKTGDPAFKCARHFLSHPDQEISRLTADLFSDKYMLSKYHSKLQKIESENDKLYELVPRIIMELKDSIILGQRKKIMEEIAANRNSDPEKLMLLMKELSHLDQLKKMTSQTLGERIVLKF